MSDHPDKNRPPFRLDLEQQSKRAKDLFKEVRANDPDALSRYRAHHPAPDTSIRLSDAQLVIARELGLPSWPKLKSHVTAMTQTRDRIAHGEAAPDAELATLHIRCGSDIGNTLKDAGFIGDFLECSDPVCQGPVRAEPDWLDLRATFLADSYRDGTEQSRDEIASDLAFVEAALRAASSRYPRIALWFEHDTYDQLILARCLAQFAQIPPIRLELISPAGYPGTTRFIGLGELPPEALRLLWSDRQLVSDSGLRAGEQAWTMLRAPDPRPLAALARAGTPALPQLGRALLRHCQELPWTTDGLGLTERLILQLLAEKPRTVGDVFHHLTMEREPLPWLADVMFWFIVRSMRDLRRPVFTSDFGSSEQDWPQQRLTITPLGEAVLARDIDFRSLHPPVRWLGGVRLGGGSPCWRWNDRDASPSLV